MKLYHGTYLQFDAVDLSKSNKGKDFGKGFYLSDNYEQARNLAVFKSIQFDAAPIVLPYEFDERNLTNGELTRVSMTIRLNGRNLSWKTEKTKRMRIFTTLMLCMGR